MFAHGDLFTPIRRYDLKMIGDLVSSEDVLIDEKEFLLYPNPIIDNISLRSDSDVVSLITVFDIYGHVVMIATSVESLDVNLLMPGSYIFKLQIDDKVVTQKMIKL